MYDYVCMHIYSNAERIWAPPRSGVDALLAESGQKLDGARSINLLRRRRRNTLDDGAKRGPDVRLIVGNRLPYITIRRRRRRRRRRGLGA